MVSVVVGKMDAAADNAAGAAGSSTADTLTQLDETWRMVAPSLFKLLVVVSGARTWLRAVRFVARAALLPSSLLGMNTPQLDEMRARVEVWRRLMVDGMLDAVIVGTEPNASVPTETKWIVYANANGVCYEHALPDIDALGKRLERSVLVFNYRGVGASTGRVDRAANLAEDVARVVRHVVQKEGAQAANVAIWGHSIGGAAGVLAADLLKHPGPVFADRSFSSLEEVVREKMADGPMAPVVAGLVAASAVLVVSVVGGLGWGATPWPALDPSDPDVSGLYYARAALSGVALARVGLRLGVASTFVYPFVIGSGVQILVGDFLANRGATGAANVPALVILAFATAFELGMLGLADRALLWLVRSLGWRMEPAKVWARLRDHTAKRCVTFHARDEMIHDGASLRHAASKDKGDVVVQLTGGDRTAPPGVPVHHMYSLATEGGGLPKAIVEFFMKP